MYWQQQGKLPEGEYTFTVAQKLSDLALRETWTIATEDGAPVNPLEVCLSPFEHLKTAPFPLYAVLVRGDLETGRKSGGTYCPVCRRVRPFADVRS